MKKLLGTLIFGLVISTAATAWCQIPYLGAPYGVAPYNPYFPPYLGGYTTWQVRTNPFTGAIESRAVVIDPATGNVQYHRRVVPRQSLYGPPVVYDMTTDPATGTVRYNSLTGDPYTGKLRTESGVYNPYTESYDRRQTNYGRSRTTSTREAYDPANRRLQTEVTEYDPQTGTYHRRGGVDVPSPPDEVNQTNGRQTQTRVYEWPPADAQQTDAAKPNREEPAPDEPNANEPDRAEP